MIAAILEILASLGLFLFGMLYLEERFKTASGHSFKRMLTNATRTDARSLTLGFSATAFFQSSSVVSLMTLSFIGAGTLSLQNGIGVILGSNLGTTVTAWAIAFVGFKLDIKLLAYSIIAIGGIGYVFGQDQSRWKNYFGGMLGFGFIFLGLEGMTESFAFISKDFDLTHYQQFNPYFFILIGIVLTAIIQSSSASIAIVQSALFTQLISFEMAALFVIGSNIGTTITVFLGAIGGSPDKKRTAMAHLLFNVSTAMIAIALILPLTWLTFKIIPKDEMVIGIALFHTIFNLLGVILWFFFIPKLSKYLQSKFTKKQLRVTKYIHTVVPNIPVVAMESLELEIKHLAQKVSEFSLFAINVVPPLAMDKHMAIEKLLERSKDSLEISYAKLYSQLQELEGEIFDYASNISLYISKKEQDKLNRLVSLATHLASASKSIKDMLSDFEILANESIGAIQRFFHDIRYQILNSVLIFNDYFQAKEENLSKMKKNYVKINNSYKKSLEHIVDIARHEHLSKTILTITINDVHLTRNFTKSLYNALRAFDERVEDDLITSPIEDETSILIKGL